MELQGPGRVGSGVIREEVAVEGAFVERFRPEVVSPV
jgi:hypothetical protein